jgi:multiple sugar transport system substrate-binding protein
MSLLQRAGFMLAMLGAAVAGFELVRRSAFADFGREGASGKTRIVWLVPMQVDRPLLEMLAREFNEQNQDIDLELIFVPGAQYQPKLKTLIAAGKPPDMFYCGDVWVAYLLPFLEDLSPLFERDAAEMDVADFYPNVLEACRFNGQIRFAPRWFTVPLLYYNRGIFDAAGEPYPAADWTWTEYVAAAKRLTRTSPVGKMVEIWGTNIVTGWWGEWLTLVRQSGGDLFNPGETKCLLDRPEAVAGMQFYHDKVWKLRIAPPPGLAPDQGFASGKLAMELVGHTGNWRAYNQIPGLDWDVQLLPSGPYSQAGGEMALEAIGMSNATPHKEACWRFLKFMMSKRAIRAHVDAGYLSIRKSVANETHLSASHTTSPRNVKAAYDALAVGQSMPHGGDWIEMALDVIQPEIDRMLADERADVAAACRRATQAADDFIRTISSNREAASNAKGPE